MMKYVPSPGIWKIFSTTNEPEIIAAVAGPRYVTTGTMPTPQRVLPHDDTLGQPLRARGAHEVLASASSMPPRVSRAIVPR